MLTSSLTVKDDRVRSPTKISEANFRSCSSLRTSNVNARILLIYLPFDRTYLHQVKGDLFLRGNIA